MVQLGVVVRDLDDRIESAVSWEDAVYERKKAQVPKVAKF